MGLFDYFKKKRSKPALPPAATPETEAPTSNHPDDSHQSDDPVADAIPVEMQEVDHGSHGDHFGGLFGFEYMSSEAGRDRVMEYVAMASIQPASMDHAGAVLKTYRFLGEDGKPGPLGIRVLEFEGNMMSAFPFLKTEHALPFACKRVTSWSHSSHLEAEVYGGGRNTFAVGFFATDFATQSESYRGRIMHEVQVSAIALVLEESDMTELGGIKVAPGFAMYSPSKDVKRPTYYDFIGTLLKCQPITLMEGNGGYLMRVKLINQEDDPEFFNLDIFINRQNMRFQNPKVGMTLAGALWFQGELV